MDLKCKDPGGLVCRDLGAYTVVYFSLFSLGSLGCLGRPSLGGRFSLGCCDRFSLGCCGRLVFIGNTFSVITVIFRLTIFSFGCCCCLFVYRIGLSFLVLLNRQVFEVRSFFTDSVKLSGFLTTSVHINNFKSTACGDGYSISYETFCQ